MLMSETGSIRLSLNLRRLSAFALFAGASAVALHAQQAAPQDVSSDNRPAAQLVADAGKAPVDLSTAIANASSTAANSDGGIDKSRKAPSHREGQRPCVRLLM